MYYDVEAIHTVVGFGKLTQSVLSENMKVCNKGPKSIAHTIYVKIALSFAIKIRLVLLWHMKNRLNVASF